MKEDVVVRRLSAVASLISSIFILCALVIYASFLQDISEFRSAYERTASEWRSSIDASSSVLNATRHKREYVTQPRRSHMHSEYRERPQYRQQGDSYEGVCDCMRIRCGSGARGPPGERGMEGVDGEPGIPGVPGVDGIQLMDQLQCPACPEGPPGPDGANGEPGPRGRAGTPGKAGPDGTNEVGLRGEIGARGPTGKPGRRGMDGEMGLDAVQLIGGPGRTGRPGPPGFAGPRGDPGTPGEPAPPGPEGPPGPTGEPGEQGEWGVRGLPGKKGPPGKDGGYCNCPRREDARGQVLEGGDQTPDSWQAYANYRKEHSDSEEYVRPPAKPTDSRSFVPEQPTTTEAPLPPDTDLSQDRVIESDTEESDPEDRVVYPTPPSRQRTAQRQRVKYPTPPPPRYATVENGNERSDRIIRPFHRGPSYATPPPDEYVLVKQDRMHSPIPLITYREDDYPTQRPRTRGHYEE